MRLVAWNANYNSRKRSFLDDVALLESLNPDLIVLSETSRSRVAEAESVAWVDQAPGLAVIARNGYAVRADERNIGAPPLFGAFHVSGPATFNLLAAWPVIRALKSSYHELLLTGLKWFDRFLADERVIFAGDLNTNTKVLDQAETHGEFVAATEARGLTSVHHHQTGDSHGSEGVMTYRHSAAAKDEFHIDYCFVSRKLLDVAKLEMQTGPEWTARSDHNPLVLDVDMSAFGGAAG